MEVLSRLKEHLFEALQEIPLIDVHTHLVGGNLGAQGLHDILLYHMSISDLYAAGCPSGKRLTEYPGQPDQQEAHARLKEAIPYLKHVSNTSINWLMRTILRDLYGWEEEVTEDNWVRLDGRIRERSNDREWHRSLLRKMNIKRAGTEIARRAGGKDDDILQYALEWAFFTRCQWGEYDTALYELERCWGNTPSSATPIGAGIRPATERTIKTLDDVQAAVDHYVITMASLNILSTATHISTDLDLSPVSDSEMEKALKCRDQAGEKERSVYASYINEAFLKKMEEKASHIVFQFSFGAEPLPYETASRLSQTAIRQVGEMVSRHSKLRFNCFLSSAHANQSMITLCRELPNLSLSGYWWHNFFPSIIHRVMEERLDMLPTNKQVGFFSDAYCLEWTYGKLLVVRQILAEVLAVKVRQGQYSLESALNIAREMLYQTPIDLLGFKPSDSL